MKSIIPSLILFLIFYGKHSVLAQTQYNRFELDLGYGRLNTAEILGGQRLIDGSVEYQGNHFSGAFSLTARYFVTHRFTIGLSIACENESGLWGSLYEDPPNILEPPYEGAYKRISYTLAPEATLTYFDAPKGFVRIYGSASIGLTFANEVDEYNKAYYAYNYYNGTNTLGNNLEIYNNYRDLNFYVSPAGLRIGRTLSGFFELGFGYKGIINGGLTYKIK